MLISLAVDSARQVLGLTADLQGSVKAPSLINTTAVMGERDEGELQDRRANLVNAG